MKKLTVLSNYELEFTNGGGIIMGTVAMLIGTAAASVAVVAAVSIPVTTWAGVGIAAGCASVSYLSFKEGVEELKEGTIF
jgi:hypothetical protein